MLRISNLARLLTRHGVLLNACELIKFHCGVTANPCLHIHQALAIPRNNRRPIDWKITFLRITVLHIVLLAS